MGPKNPWDGFSAVAKYKIFVPDLLELYTQFPRQKLWAKALNTSTLTTTALKHRDLPPPQGSQPTGMCAPGEDRSEGGFSYLCYTCVAGKPAAGCDALNSRLFHTGWNPPVHCCIWEMKGLTKAVTLPNQFYFLTAIWVRAPQVRAELLSKTSNFSWLLTAHVWRQKCDIRDRGHFPLLGISWSVGKLFMKAAFCPAQVSPVGVCKPQKALKEAGNTESVGTNWYTQCYRRVFCLFT